MAMQIDPDLPDEIRRFERQYAENPDSLVFARLADLHRKGGRAARALEIVEQGLERHPDYLSAHIVRARCLRDLDRRSEAEAAFRRVLELDGENLVAFRSLAEMAWERGDGGAARDHLRDLLQLDPRNEEARELLEEIAGEPLEEPDGREREPSAEEVFAAEGDEVAVPVEEEAVGTAGRGEASIIEPSARREGPGPDGAEDRGRAFDFGSREPGAGEAGSGTGAVEAEPGTGEPAPGEAGVEDEADVPAPGPPEASDPPSAGEEAEEDASGSWWDFLRSGGGPAEEPEPAPREAGVEDEADAPAAGPAQEAEELRTQIQELRTRAEREIEGAEVEGDLATETLANLYEAQGFYREAVEMYEELVSRRPDDEELRRRLERAREALEGTAAASAVTAAAQLRAVLRGEASPEPADPDGP